MRAVSRKAICRFVVLNEEPKSHSVKGRIFLSSAFPCPNVPRHRQVRRHRLAHRTHGFVWFHCGYQQALTNQKLGSGALNPRQHHTHACRAQVPPLFKIGQWRPARNPVSSDNEPLAQCNLMLFLFWIQVVFSWL